MNTDTKAVGFKDMAEEQIKDLLTVVAHAANFADVLREHEVESAEEIWEDLEQMVTIFGGNSIEIVRECTVDY